jgi:hypothetical protein
MSENRELRKRFGHMREQAREEWRKMNDEKLFNA